MLKRHYHFATLIAFLGLTGLTGCQQPSAPPGATPKVAATLPGITTPPACARLTATLDHGLVVQYDGSTPSDPNVCLVRWQNSTHQYYLGFWGDGRTLDAPPDERKAVLDALTGPIGTQTSYTPHGGKLWSNATITHVDNPVLTIDGQSRPTVELRRVLHDAMGRSEVRAESLLWVDQVTGIALLGQTITRMANGQQMATTTWQVRSLQPAV
jgi:hypothetical protein